MSLFLFITLTRSVSFHRVLKVISFGLGSLWTTFFPSEKILSEETKSRGNEGLDIMALIISVLVALLNPP